MKDRIIMGVITASLVILSLFIVAIISSFVLWDISWIYKDLRLIGLMVRIAIVIGLASGIIMGVEK